MNARTCAVVQHLRMPANFLPDTPTMLRSPTLPRRRRSNMVRPTTPTFLSEPEAPPPTKPVVYSPVPTWIFVSRCCSLRQGQLALTINTLGGAIIAYSWCYRGRVGKGEIEKQFQEGRENRRGRIEVDGEVSLLDIILPAIEPLFNSRQFIILSAAGLAMTSSWLACNDCHCLH